MNGACPDQVPFDRLLAYQLGELPAAESEALEEHYFGCASCSDWLDFLGSLRLAVVEVVQEGLLSVGVTDALVQRARAAGMQLREYAIEPGGSVDCTVAPDDALVIVRLGLKLAPEEDVDLQVTMTDRSTGAVQDATTRGVPADIAGQQIVFAYSGDLVRTFPDSQWRVTARIDGPEGQRASGPYELNHSRWRDV